MWAMQFARNYGYALYKQGADLTKNGQKTEEHVDSLEPPPRALDAKLNGENARVSLNRQTAPPVSDDRQVDYSSSQSATSHPLPRSENPVDDVAHNPGQPSRGITLAPTSTSDIGTMPALEHVMSDGAESRKHRSAARTSGHELIVDRNACESPGKHYPIPSSGAFGRGGSILIPWELPHGLNSESFYTRGPAQIFQRSDGKGGLCLRLTHELSERMKEKIETSRYYRALRSAVNQRLVDLDEEDRRIETLQREQHQEMKRILDILDEDDREPTTEEELKVRSLSAEIDEEALQRKDMDAEREYLPKYLSHFARKWLELVEHVEAVEDEVLTSCKLLSKFEDKIEVPWQELPIGPGQPSLASRIPLWPLSIPPTNTVDTVKPATPDQDEETHSRLAEKARSTRHAFQAACERHDNYRREYGSRLKHYIAQQANGTGADLEADFAKHWLEGWRGLIRDVDSAEKAAIKATDDARAANVTIFDPMDDQESNSAYSVDRRNIKSMKQLDRSQIERWNTSVVAGVWGPEHPAGDDEAELEEQAEAKQLGQRAAEISTSKYEPAAMMPQKDLSIAREQITIGQAALRVPQDKSTPLQRIEQILTEVRAALSRTDESTSPHAGEPSLMNVVAVEEAPKVFNQSSATGENCFPENSGAHKVTEGTAEVLNKSPKRKRSEDDGTTQEEPASKRHGGEMNRKWDEDLYEYMQKYKIESPPVSKKRNQDNILLNRIILVTDSDRAYGHEQRCIDEWSYKVRDGDC